MTMKLELRKKAMGEMLKEPSIQIKKKAEVEAETNEEGKKVPFMVTEEEKQMILEHRKAESGEEEANAEGAEEEASEE